MPYQALYRKYRPTDFDSVVGQKHIVQTLKNAIEKNRIAHAYLFTGPRGTGKTSTAKIFAKALNCTGSPVPCEKCDNCKAVQEQNHPDIVEIDAASNNGVDEVRSLIDRVYYAPVLGKYKIYIIDEVHMMTTGAFNALLKTIEEPPENVIFILATTEPNKVLPTILSRCQRFDFSQISDAEIKGRLKYICDQENYPAEDAALELIASLAQGGMRDSLSLLDQCIAFSPDSLSADNVREIYGVITKQDIAELFSDLDQGKSDEAISRLVRFSDQGMDLKKFTSDFISILKNSLLYSISENTTLISDEEKELLKKYFAPSSVQKRIRLLNDLMETYNRLNYSSNILDYIQVALLRSSLLQSDQESSQSYEQKKVEKMEAKKESDHSDKNAIFQGSSPKIKEKPRLSDLFWKSDVSRETFLKSEKESEQSEFSDDMLLGLLLGGNKDEKKSDEKFRNHIRENMNDIQYGRFAAALKNYEPVADGPSFILAALPNKLSADAVNEMENSFGFEDYTEAVLGKRKIIFAITKDRARKLIGIFRERRQANSLPPVFEVVPRAKEENKELNVEEYLKGIFPELEVIDD